MSCQNPSIAVRLLSDPVTGKQKIKFFGDKNKGSVNWSVESLMDKYGSENVLFLDCGHCASCLKKRRREWSVRCELESRSHAFSTFITLTYDDDHYPGCLDKTHIRSFFKSLYNHGIKFRYYGCSEKGSESGRWHHHIILFGYRPDDLVYYSRTKSGGYQFTSEFLSKIWNKGFVTVCDFEPGLAAYVAGYVNKKLEDPNDESYQFMSTRPGIGFGYFMKNMPDIYESTSLVTTFGSHRSSIPRYLDKLADLVDYDIKAIRESRAESSLNNLHAKARDLGVSQLDLAVGIDDMSSKDRYNTLKRRGL